MNLTKKLACFMAVVICFTLFPSAMTADTAAAFTDTKQHWSNSTLHWAKEQGMAAGYPDGSFKPNAVINEAEFITLLFRAFDVDMSSGKWPEAAYAYAKRMNYPLRGMASDDERKASITRSYAAEMIAWADGEALYGNKAIQYLLDKEYSKGKESATVNGYLGGEDCR